jgi:hypothetical protein
VTRMHETTQPSDLTHFFSAETAGLSSSQMQ